MTELLNRTELKEIRPLPKCRKKLHDDHRHVDSRLVGNRMLMVKILKISACYLITN